MHNAKYLYELSAFIVKNSLTFLSNRRNLKISKQNNYAIVTMAGGQGTRLGHKGPKGTFELNLYPEK